MSVLKWTVLKNRCFQVFRLVLWTVTHFIKFHCSCHVLSLLEHQTLWLKQPDVRNVKIYCTVIQEIFNNIVNQNQNKTKQNHIKNTGNIKCFFTLRRFFFFFKYIKFLIWSIELIGFKMDVLWTYLPIYVHRTYTHRHIEAYILHTDIVYFIPFSI